MKLRDGDNREKALIGKFGAELRQSVWAHIKMFKMRFLAILTAVVLIGWVAAVFYRSISLTRAETSHVTVTDNNQTIIEVQQTGEIVIRRTSTVTVRDTDANFGYNLTAALSANTLSGAVVEIYADSLANAQTSTCTSDSSTNPCKLTDVPTAILVTSDDTATNAAGETVVFDVKITIPAGAQIGNYTVDIAYDEEAIIPVPQPPASNASGLWVKSSTAVTGDTSNNIIIDKDDNMVAVVNKADKRTAAIDWANYDNKKWANAVTLDDSNAKYNCGGGENTCTALAYFRDYAAIGAAIPEDDVLGYWVYVPRYAYEVMRHSGIDKSVAATELFAVRFEKSTAPKKTPAVTCSSSDGTENYSGVPSHAKDYRTECGISRDYPTATPYNHSTWSTHPAFTTSTGRELNGFWVAKYELTGSATAPTVKPSLKSQVSQTVGVQYAIVKAMGVLDVNNVGGSSVSGLVQNSHNLGSYHTTQMRNDQWGAAAYLSASVYGAGVGDHKVQNNGAFSKVLQDGNGNTGIGITGCGPNPSGDETEYPILETAVTGAVDCTYSNQSLVYYSELGQLASTTHNVYGIYDMAGGAWEITAAVSNGRMGGSMPTALNANYYNNYPDNPLAIRPSWSSEGYSHYYNIDACTYQYCGGHALHEVAGVQSVYWQNQFWDGDYSWLVDGEYPWAYRGGSADYGQVSGIWAADAYNGGAWEYYSMRAVMGRL
ncbi:MAG: hypothetical protein LBQ02_04240 [Candidatus Nomurabacteria bacterium]|jgi:hypothetical protein|nr:hypothetical protein [Candidatus Nomurabacteria bacterium]